MGHRGRNKSVQRIIRKTYMYNWKSTSLKIGSTRSVIHLVFNIAAMHLSLLCSLLLSLAWAWHVLHLMTCAICNIIIIMPAACSVPIMFAMPGVPVQLCVPVSSNWACMFLHGNIQYITLILVMIAEERVIMNSINFIQFVIENN